MLEFKRISVGSLPQVGQVWRHMNDGKNIYMRIRDRDGEVIFKNREESFYSVRLNSEDSAGWVKGAICTTDRNSNDIEVLV